MVVLGNWLASVPILVQILNKPLSDFYLFFANAVVRGWRKIPLGFTSVTEFVPAGKNEPSMETSE
jgi:hypothetical protein